MSIFNWFRRKQPSPLFGLIYGSDKAIQTDEIEGGQGEFGLVSTNPIPVRGLASIEVYFRRLVTEDGQMVRANRVKALYDIPNVKDPVDEYDVLDQNGKFLTKMYVMAYHGKISDRAPKGYRLAVKNGW